MANGECNCGAVQFSIAANLSDVFICHCSICRRATGANGIAVLVVPNEQFRWLAGESQISMWSKPDADWQFWFCKVCGSAVPGRNDDTRMYVPAGTLTSGGESLKVAHHIWVDSKAIWDEIGDAGVQHAEGIGS